MQLEAPLNTSEMNSIPVSIHLSFTLPPKIWLIHQVLCLNETYGKQWATCTDVESSTTSSSLIPQVKVRKHGLPIVCKNCGLTCETCPYHPYSSLNVDSRLCQAFHSSQLGYLTASLFHLQVTSQRPLMQGHRKLEVQTVFVEADVLGI